MQNVRLSEKYPELFLKYEFAKKTVELELDILVKEFEFREKYNPIEHIKSRIKSSESILLKLQRQGYEETEENIKKQIHDVVGVRIVCSFLSDVYDIVNIIKSSKQFQIVDESDYIKNPKSSGYISYHLNILVPIHLTERTEYIETEIQLRTMAMDFWASLDHKLRYKMPKILPETLEDEMVCCSDDINYLDQKMQNLYEIVKKYRKVEK